MSDILLVDQVTPSTPSATQRLVYPKNDTVQGYVLAHLASDGKEILLSNASGGLAKNAIIGGDFSTNPWQRGTSFSSVASATYTADRFAYFKSGAMVHDVSKSADAPTVAQAGRLTNHSLLIDCTTVDSSIAAGDFCRVLQNIEGYNFLPFAQRSFTLSFWHKHTKTGTYCVAFGNSGQDRSYVAEYAQAVTDTWEKASITVTASPSAGTWDYTNGTGLTVSFCLTSGTTYQTTANAWQTGLYLATSNQVNACDSTANNFKIALVQLEAGPVATEFEARTVGQELTLCERYCKSLYNGSQANEFIAMGFATSTTIGQPSMQVSPAMRTVPSLSISAASNFSLSDGVAAVACTILTIAGANVLNEKTASFIATVAAGLTQYHPYRLEGNSTSARMYLVAEL